MYKLLIFIACAFIPYTSFSQLSIDDARKYLTNGTYRDWKFKEYKTDLGTASCSGDGQLFEFLSNGKLIWKKCEHGSSIDATLSWSISPVQNSLGEYMITFSSPVKQSDSGSPIISLQLYFDAPKVKVKNMVLTFKSTRNKLQQTVQTFKLLSIN